MKLRNFFSLGLLLALPFTVQAGGGYGSLQEEQAAGGYGSSLQEEQADVIILEEVEPRHSHTPQEEEAFHQGQDKKQQEEDSVEFSSSVGKDQEPANLEDSDDETDRQQEEMGTGDDYIRPSYQEIEE